MLAWAEQLAPYGLIARSSAPGEGGTTASFAGLYDSVITPRTPGRVLAAILQVRACVHAPTVTAYAAARGLRPDDELAVLVQPVRRSPVSWPIRYRWPAPTRPHRSRAPRRLRRPR